MTQMEYDIATIKAQVGFILSQVEDLASKIPEAASEAIPENVTLETAAALKGGAAIGTYRTRRYLQPCGGVNFIRVGGRKCWKKQDIVEWLAIDDEKLPAYLKKFGVEKRDY